MVIAIWCGESKPILNEFLRPFVDELNELLRHGVMINGFQIKVFVRCFICDSPARAHIKGTVNFNHRFGCQKCVIQGTFMRRRMSFHRIPDFYVNSNRFLRTDMQFRDRVHPQHHREPSILEELEIDMIGSFIVADALHLLDLGLMKRYFVRWIYGEKLYRKLWNDTDIERINAQLLQFNDTLPSEIHRKTKKIEFSEV